MNHVGNQHTLGRIIAALGCAGLTTFGVLVLLDPVQSVSWARLGLFVVAPIMLAAVILAVLIWRPAWLGMGAVYAASIGVAMLGAEIYLAKSAIEAPAAGADNAVARDADDPDLGMQLCANSVNPSDPPYRIDGQPVLPLGGIAGLPLSASPMFNADRHGFNNPDAVWNFDRMDLAFVGDSFTYGADVAFGMGFVDLVRRVVPRTVNLGCGGNGPLAELGTMVEYGSLLRPRLLVWVFFEGNDLTKDIYDEAGAPLLAGYWTDGYSQVLASRQSALDLEMRRFLAERRVAETAAGAPPSGHGALPWRQIVTVAHLRTALGLRHAVRPQALDMFERTLARARDITKAWGATPLLVYLPAETRYATAFGRWDAAGYANQVKAIARDAGFTVIAVDDVIDAQDNPRDLYRGHFTPRGYALVGCVILNALLDRGEIEATAELAANCP